MKVSTYQLVTPGRLRIKVPRLKGSSEIAQRAERVLKNIKGVSNATANPLTGNALVLFDPQTITDATLIEVLKRQGYLEKRCRVSQRSSKAVAQRQSLYPQRISKTVADTLLQTAIELALRRSLLALG